MFFLISIIMKSLIILSHITFPTALPLQSCEKYNLLFSFTLENLVPPLSILLAAVSEPMITVQPHLTHSWFLVLMQKTSRNECNCRLTLPAAWGGIWRVLEWHQSSYTTWGGLHCPGWCLHYSCSLSGHPLDPIQPVLPRGNSCLM